MGTITLIAAAVALAVLVLGLLFVRGRDLTDVVRLGDEFVVA